jgi:hypothetical protein
VITEKIILQEQQDLTLILTAPEVKTILIQDLIVLTQIAIIVAAVVDRREVVIVGAAEDRQVVEDRQVAAEEDNALSVL